MSEISFYNVDFYKDHENVVDFASATARNAYFAAHALNIEVGNIQVVKPPYEYVKVAGNYNEFQGVNYCIFSLDVASSNGDIVTRDYYCFVDKVDYAGVGVVGLALTLDVWQSSLYTANGSAGFTLGECFVERAHVNYYDSANDASPDRTFLDIAEDIETGDDREYVFLDRPGVPELPELEADNPLNDLVFLVVNYTDFWVVNALIGSDANVSIPYGGNMGGTNPIYTAIIPVLPNHSMTNVYLAVGDAKSTKRCITWAELFNGDNGVLRGQKGLVSAYIETSLPGQWTWEMDSGNVVVTLPSDVDHTQQYGIIGDSLTSGKYVIIIPENSASRNGIASCQGRIVSPYLVNPFVNAETRPAGLDASIPWTVEKKAYCYPYYYPFLETDRGYEYIIKPQFFPKYIPYTYGQLLIMMTYACADFRKVGYYVYGYKKDNVAVLNNLPVFSNGVNPEVIDMTANNNQTDVPLISDALVEYVQSKKASERAGLVNQIASAFAGGSLGSLIGGRVGAVGGVVGGVTAAVRTAIARRKDLADTPNTVRSPGNDYGFEMAAGSSGLALMLSKLPNGRLQSVISYFERYGIAINRSMQINTKCRALWNFVKTIGARIETNLNAEYSEGLRQIFDNGVRIWHYGDGSTWQGVGAYSENGSTRWNGEVYG